MKSLRPTLAFMMFASALVLNLPKGVSAACSDYTTCTVCAQNVLEGCAWCGDGVCKTPIPFTGNCPSPIFLGGSCPDNTPCSNYKGCTQCMQHVDDGCAYCTRTQQCGTYGELLTCGTTIKIGSCDFALPALPAVSAEVCQKLGSCSSCVSKFADTTCTWCNATQTCDIAQNWLTGIALTCPSPAVDNLLCIAYTRSIDDCSLFTDCTSCVSKFTQDTCTWCVGTQTCNTALNQLTCTSPAVENLVCSIFTRECSQQFDCTSCTALDNVGCVWCNTTSKCQGVTDSCATTSFFANLQCPGATGLQVLPAPVECRVRNGNCAGCVSITGCTYCTSSEECKVITDTECDNVADVKVTAAQCEAIQLCPSKTSCTSCVETLTDGCAWCPNTAKCQSASDSCSGRPVVVGAQCSRAKATCQAKKAGCSGCVAEIGAGCAWCDGKCDLSVDQATCSGAVVTRGQCPAGSDSSSSFATVGPTAGSTSSSADAEARLARAAKEKEDAAQAAQTKQILLVAIVAGVVVLIIAIAVLVLIFKKRKHNHQMRRTEPVANQGQGPAGTHRSFENNGTVDPRERQPEVDADFADGGTLQDASARSHIPMGNIQGDGRPLPAAYGGHGRALPQVPQREAADVYGDYEVEIEIIPDTEEFKAPAPVPVHQR